MASKINLTPCIVCEKAVVRLWDHTDASNLNSASYLHYFGDYGSGFDENEYQAVICDDCLDNAIQSKKVNFVGKLN
jgi:hypothetical protein